MAKKAKTRTNSPFKIGIASAPEPFDVIIKVSFMACKTVKLKEAKNCITRSGINLPYSPLCTGHTLNAVVSIGIFYFNLKSKVASNILKKAGRRVSNSYNGFKKSKSYIEMSCPKPINLCASQKFTSLYDLKKERMALYIKSCVIGAIKNP